MAAATEWSKVLICGVCDRYPLSPPLLLYRKLRVSGEKMMVWSSCRMSVDIRYKFSEEIWKGVKLVCVI